MPPGSLRRRNERAGATTIYAGWIRYFYAVPSRPLDRDRAAPPDGTQANPHRDSKREIAEKYADQARSGDPERDPGADELTSLRGV
jgi:hypothetical protein